MANAECRMRQIFAIWHLPFAIAGCFIQQPAKGPMPSNDTRPPEEADDIGPIRLGEYVALAWRFKWLLVLSAVASGTLMFVSSTSGSRVYESTVTFAATPSKIGDTNPGTTASPASFRPMIESRTTALTAIC